MKLAVVTGQGDIKNGHRACFHTTMVTFGYLRAQQIKLDYFSMQRVTVSQKNVFKYPAFFYSLKET